jgi:hypothetical protein
MPTDDMAEMTPAQKKLFELRMKVNAGRKANKKVFLIIIDQLDGLFLL